MPSAGGRGFPGADRGVRFLSCPGGKHRDSLRPPLRHTGTTGEPVKIRARMVPGPATILITALNREGLDVKVQEAKIEVK